MFRSIIFVIFVLFFMVSCSNDDPEAENFADLDNVAIDNETGNDSELNDDAIITDEFVESDDEIITDDDVTSVDESIENDDVAVDEETSDDESSNLNTGDISGDQAEAGKPGAICTKDEDCTNWAGTEPQDAICLLPSEGYPGGYCSFMCDGSVAMNYGCNGYGGIYYGFGKFGDGYCFHRCDDPTDCRVGYRCSKSVGACMPDCAVDACSLGTCDETEKVCLDK